MFLSTTSPLQKTQGYVIVVSYAGILSLCPFMLRFWVCGCAFSHVTYTAVPELCAEQQGAVVHVKGAVFLRLRSRTMPKPEFTHAKLKHDLHSSAILHARVLCSSVYSPKSRSSWGLTASSSLLVALAVIAQWFLLLKTVLKVQVIISMWTTKMQIQHNIPVSFGTNPNVCLTLKGSYDVA